MAEERRTVGASTITLDNVEPSAGQTYRMGKRHPKEHGLGPKQVQIKNPPELGTSDGSHQGATDMTSAPVNVSPSPKSIQAYTFLGRGEMADILSPHTCSLCGVVITNFRIVHPIMRYDASRPYFHRTGRNRGLSPERRIGWSCGKHRTIDQNWLENSYTKPLDTLLAIVDTAHMALIARDEIKGIRSKLNLTQEQFARKLGVTTSSVSKWESGAATVTERTLIQARSLIMTNGEKESYA